MLQILYFLSAFEMGIMAATGIRVGTTLATGSVGVSEIHTA
jgi:hypothetical protein